MFRDPLTYKEEFSLKCHSGGVSSIDVSGNYVVTTGYSVRGSALLADPMIKVLDLRTHKFLAPIPCSAGPMFVRFHPNYAASILAGSREGSLQLNDLHDSNQTKSQYFQASLSGYMTALEFSPSGEFFAVGDVYGNFQLWSQRPNPKINNYSRPISYRDPPFLNNHPVIEDDM